MRGLLRFASVLLLALAVGVGVFDSIRSVARSALDLTSLALAWATLSAQSLIAAETAIAGSRYGKTFEQGFGWLLVQPAGAILLFLALLLWIAAYSKGPAAGRFAA